MNVLLCRQLVAMTTLSLASTLASADLVSSPAATFASPTVGFDTNSGTTVLGVITLPMLSAPASNGSAEGTRSSALGQTVLLTINNNFDLTLWNFITTVRAQQANQPIPLVQASVNNIALTLNDTVSQVPLPAGAWLFLSGLLGIVGVKWQRRSSGLPSKVSGASPVGSVSCAAA